MNPFLRHRLEEQLWKVTPRRHRRHRPRDGEREILRADRRRWHALSELGEAELLTLSLVGELPN